MSGNNTLKMQPSPEVVAALEASVVFYKDLNDKLSRGSRVWHREALYWSKEAGKWRIIAAAFAASFIISFVTNLV